MFLSTEYQSIIGCRKWRILREREKLLLPQFLLCLSSGSLLVSLGN
uniref:Uncharacterized protein n=1 Tax=Rhizophora mucronata TaxID=61149 RepID=A0A2P2PIC4_RHIMU